MPFGRFASADEVADLITFLAGPRAASISGTTVRIDGAATPTPRAIRAELVVPVPRRPRGTIMGP